MIKKAWVLWVKWKSVSLCFHFMVGFYWNMYLCIFLGCNYARNENSLSQWPGWIHPGELPGENLSCKTIPRWKSWSFLTFQSILHNLAHLGANVQFLLFHGDLSSFTPMPFGLETIRGDLFPRILGYIS